LRRLVVGRRCGRGPLLHGRARAATIEHDRGIDAEVHRHQREHDRADADAAAAEAHAAAVFHIGAATSMLDAHRSPRLVVDRTAPALTHAGAAGQVRAKRAEYSTAGAREPRA